MYYLNLNPDEKLKNYYKHNTLDYQPIVNVEGSKPFTIDVLGGTTSLADIASFRPAPQVPATVVEESKDSKKDSEEFTTPSYTDFTEHLNSLKALYFGGEPGETGITRTNPETGANYHIGTPEELRENMRKRLGLTESGNQYSAHNKQTGLNGKPGSGAHGKYQYIWSVHKDGIQKVTGITSAEAFRKSPEAQEKYFDHMFDTWLTPSLKRIRSLFPNLDLSDSDIMQGVHFRGLDGKNGFIELLRTSQLDVKKESNNPTVNEILEKGRMWERS